MHKYENDLGCGWGRLSKTLQITVQFGDAFALLCHQHRREYVTFLHIVVALCTNAD